VGFSISWIAVRGLEKQELLQRFGLYDTGEIEEYPDSPICGTFLPDNAYLLCLSDCFHRFVTPKFLKKASKGCSILGCQVEEHIMASAAFFYRDGERLWNVVHESDRGIEHLDAEGEVPAPFRDIHREAVENQRKEESRVKKPNEILGVDYIFDVPVRLATALTGYSHDRMEFSWGKPTYTKLQEGRLN
jgi:hypothetical protein